MTIDFLFKHHPWILLKESLTTFPNEQQLIAMKNVMDGKSDINKNDLSDGMKLVGAKNIYDLVLWGLKTGVIRDNPLSLGDGLKTNEANPVWLMILKYTASGYSAAKMDKEVGIGKDTLDHYKKLIRQKYSLGNSQAEFVRFAFQTTNPISPPPVNKLYKPYQDKSTLKYPPVLSKFRPSDVDPDIPVYDRSDQHADKQDREKVQLNIPKSAKKVNRHIPKTTHIQQALELLGINRQAIGTNPGGKNYKAFWKRSPDLLWRILELAKRRYELEISHAHPDNKATGNIKRAMQLNAAWKLIQRFFANHGYELH